MRHEKALIITSDPELRQDIEDCLIKLSLELHHTDNYLQALNLVARYHYALVVMDLALSKISGVELIRRIQELEQTPMKYGAPRKDNSGLTIM